MLPRPRGSIRRAASRAVRNPAQQAISQTLRNTRSVVSSSGKLTLAPMLKTQTSSGAAASASWRNVVISSSLRASSERPTTRPPATSISATNGASLSPCRRPAKTVNPSDANFLAIAAPMKSPAPITAAAAFLYSKSGLLYPSDGPIASRVGQSVLEDFVGRGGRQPIHNDDLGGALVGRQQPRGMRHEIRWRDGGAWQ